MVRTTNDRVEKEIDITLISINVLLATITFVTTAAIVSLVYALMYLIL